MLNESKGNMYEFVTHTWNTVKGECPHGCTYCYMKRFGKQNPASFDEKELKTDLGKGNFIFVGSSCDMFAENINYEWIIKTLSHCADFNNKYLFQTKNPKAFSEFAVQFASMDDISFCTTIESDSFIPEIMNNSPEPMQRSIEIAKVSEFVDCFVTIEPIMDFHLEHFIRMIRRCNPKQVNIGANTSNIKLPEPPKEKIIELISEIEKFTKVVQKSNLKRLLK